MTGGVIDRTGCSGNSFTGHHGSNTDYRYGCRCEDARKAHRDYKKLGSVGLRPAGRVRAIGCQRRFRALAAIGWSAPALGRMLGHRDGTWVRQVGTRGQVNRPQADRFTALYERLSMTPGPSDIARRRAAKAGWAPPMAWEHRDMDDPQAYPSRGHNRRGPLQGEPSTTDVDDVIAGRQHLYTLQPRYRASVIDTMTQWGLGSEAIAKRLNLEDRTVLRYRAQLRAAKEAAAEDAVKVPA